MLSHRTCSFSAFAHQRLLCISTIVLLLLSGGQVCASSESIELERSSPTPYQQYYNTLEQRLNELEADNSTNSKLFVAGTAFVLDMALELTHAWFLQKYNTEFFYQASPTDLTHTTRDLLLYTLTNGHIPALLMGATAWLSGNISELPNLQTDESLLQIGLISGMVAGGYSWLTGQMKRNSTKTDFFNITGHPELNRLPPEARPPFRAGLQLNNMKYVLQAAAMAVIVTTGYLARSQKKVEIHDLRQSLSMARDRLHREYRKSEDFFPNIPATQ